MSRELWVCEFSDGTCAGYTWSSREGAEDFSADNKYVVRAARYVPADSLQPEWWCEVLTEDDVRVYARMGDSTVSIECSARESPSVVISELAYRLASKLWCGGL